MTSREWDQRPGEPDRAYAQFLAYRDLGVARTLEAAWGVAKRGKVKHGRPTTVFYALAQTWDWSARAVAWDRSLSDDFEAQIKERKALIMEAEFAAGERVLNLINQALDNLTGGDVQARDLPNLLRVASDLMRKSADMATEHLRLDVEMPEEIDATTAREMLVRMGVESAVKVN